MNKYPAKSMMDQMAGHGRYGDSMLVHMNPAEVQGLASLSPTGQLTTNPMTGQPEAFLPFLAPLLGMAGGALGLSTIGTAALTGVGTAALTGDLKRGLISGLTAGVAGGIGDLFSSAAEGAQVGVDAATAAADAGTTTIDLGANIAEQGANLGTGLDMTNQVAQGSLQNSMAAAQPTGFEAFSQGVDNFVGGMSPTQSLMAAGMGSGQLAQMDYQDDMNAMAGQQEQDRLDKLKQSYGDLQSGYRAAQPNTPAGLSPMRSRMSNLIPAPFVPGMNEGGSTSPLVVEPTDEEAAVLALAKNNRPLSAADQSILEGYYNRRNQQIAANADDQAAAEAEESVIRIEDGDTNEDAVRTLYNAGLINSQDFGWFMTHLTNTDALDSQYLASESFPGLNEYLDQNGFNEENSARVRRIVGNIQRASSEEGIPVGDLNNITEGFFNSGFGGLGNMGYGGIDPIAIQAGLRGDFSVAPPPDYMLGFEPEFSYFQDDPNNIRIPTRTFRPTQSGIESTGEYFDPILDKAEYMQQLRDYYTALANYRPAQPYYPEEPPSVEDDPDNQGEDDNEQEEDDVLYPDVTDPVDPAPDPPPPPPPSYEPVFEQGVSLVNQKRWADMSEAEKIVHTYMRGESDWYSDKEGSSAWNQAMGMVDEMFGDRVGDYMIAFRNEAIERAMAGNAGISLQEMLDNAGYASVDDFLANNTDDLQRELLGNYDYHSSPDEYSFPAEPSAKQGPAGPKGGGITDVAPTATNPDGTTYSNPQVDDSYDGEGFTFGGGLEATATTMDVTVPLMDTTGSDIVPNMENLQAMIDSGRVTPDGRLVTEGVSRDDLYEMMIGGFGLGSSDLHRSLIDQAKAAFAGDNLIFDSTSYDDAMAAAQDIPPAPEPVAEPAPVFDFSPVAGSATASTQPVAPALAPAPAPPPPPPPPAPVVAPPPPPPPEPVSGPAKGGVIQEPQAAFSPSLPDSGGLDFTGYMPPPPPPAPEPTPAPEPMVSPEPLPSISAKGGTTPAPEPAPAPAPEPTPEEEAELVTVPTKGGTFDAPTTNLEAAVQEEAEPQPVYVAPEPAMVAPTSPTGGGFSGGSSGTTRLKFAEGGQVPIRTPMGEEGIQAGGIANVPTAQNGNMPTEEDFNMVASALMGMTDEATADAIINNFIGQYGPDMFAQLRDMILKQNVPNAQTEGMIQGQGSGMDDMVGGMIGSQQPVAVSPGEFIVPADVVSGLGDGSSDAGAQELDQMMSRVRMARGGTTDQAPAINAQGILPA
jgi:hypothetical protein